GKALELAACHDASVGALVIGDHADAVAADVVSRGAAVAYTVSDTALAAYLPKPYATAAAAVLDQHPARLVLLPASTVGNDLAPVLAGRLDAAAILDCCDVTCDGQTATFKRLEFDA